MSTYQPGDSTPITSAAQLADFLSPVQPVQGRLGLEWEVLPVDGGGRLVPYHGPRGLESALRLLSPPHEVVMDSGHIAALKWRGGGMVGLEPGGQVEIASPPATRLRDIEAFMKGAFDEVAAAASSMGFGLEAWGMAPWNGEDDLPDVPKARYALLRDHLRRSGSMGRRMMKLTAATQISMDYQDEEDLRDLLRVTLPALPFLVAFLANSPFTKGRRTGWASQRPRIWRHTDRLRCGLPAFLFSPRLTYKDVVRWAGSRPLLFLVRGARWVPGDGRSFHDWLASPGPWGPLTVDDWALHVSTLFPDVRIRGYLEIRVPDSVPLPLAMAACALCQGLALPAGRRKAASFLPRAERRALPRDLLDAGRLGPRWVPTWCEDARTGMGRLLAAAEEGLMEAGEDLGFLEPLKELAREGACPADSWRLTGF